MKKKLLSGREEGVKNSRGKSCQKRSQQDWSIRSEYCHQEKKLCNRTEKVGKEKAEKQLQPRVQQVRRSAGPVPPLPSFWVTLSLPLSLFSLPLLFFSPTFSLIFLSLTFFLSLSYFFYFFSFILSYSHCFIPCHWNVSSSKQRDHVTIIIESQVKETSVWKKGETKEGIERKKKKRNKNRITKQVKNSNPEAIRHLTRRKEKEEAKGGRRKSSSNCSLPLSLPPPLSLHWNSSPSSSSN